MGADLLVRAFALVARSSPNVQLTIVGDGLERGSLIALSASLGVSSIRFTGALKGEELVRELYRQHCIVVPSRWQKPFGVVALEGMACCDTVIVISRGALPKAVGLCGLVVEPTIEALLVAMPDVVRARAEGRRLSAQPDEDTRAAHLAAHQAEVAASRYIEVLQSTLGRLP